MCEVHQNPKELELGQEAIDSTFLSPSDRPKKFRNHKPYGRPEFDKFLDKYDAVLDIPSCVFAKELLEAYSEAKVILTTRSYQDWEVSMQDSIWYLCTLDLFKLARYFNLKEMASLMRFIHSMFRFRKKQHLRRSRITCCSQGDYSTVRSLVLANNLLEIDPEHTSWELLGEVLGQQIPEKGCQGPRKRRQ